MKRLATVISILGLTGLFLLTEIHCKYENGPFISFRSKQERVVNHWKLEKYLWNGMD